MGWQIKLLLIMACACVGMGWASGQTPTGVLKTIGQPPANPAALLNDPAVKKAVKLTDDQLKNLDKDLWKVLKIVLEPGQYQRLKEIDLRQRGAKAFAESDVQNELKLNDDQKAAIQRILDDCEVELANLAKVAPRLDPRDLKVRYDSIHADAIDACAKLLTSKQWQAWLWMIGDEFPPPPPQDRRIPFPPAKGKAKKKDN